MPTKKKLPLKKATVKTFANFFLVKVAKKISDSNGKVEWIWEEANFAWELGPPPLVEDEQSNEDDRGIVIMVYDKDRLSAPQVLLDTKSREY